MLISGTGEKISEPAKNFIMEKIQPYIDVVKNFWAEHGTVIMIVAVVLVGLAVFFGVLRAKVNRDERRKNRRNRY